MSSIHAGQIVRIKLKNFMCYNEIEIYPRNQLNVIIAPNGSGKSSLACAVVLGLGGKLKILERADHFSSYVKKGEDHCIIKIELFEPNGCNVVIKRKIMSKDNGSEFKVNRKVSTLAKVKEIRKHFNIQIDSLCTFLPQEKIPELAKLNSKQLLEEVLGIVGQCSLVDFHAELKKLQLNIKTQEKEKISLENKLGDLKQKNERLRNRVDCLRVKNSLYQKLKSLKQKRAWLQYDEEVEKKEEIDQDCRLIENLYSKNHEMMLNVREILSQLEGILCGLEKKLDVVKNKEAEMKVTLKKKEVLIDETVDRLEHSESLLEFKREEQKKKRIEIIRYDEKIKKLKEDLLSIDGNIGPIDEVRSFFEKADSELKSFHLKEVHLSDTKLKLEDEEGSLKDELNSTMETCQALQMRRTARLQYLKKYEPDAYKSMEWLEKNRNMFQSHIYNPMLLELDVPKSEMAKYVETRLGYNDLISFACTNADDLNLLVQKLRTEQGLKVNVICCDRNVETEYSPEIPINEISCYGFFAYLKDLITGPPDIIRFLCRTYKIHLVPVGDKTVEDNLEKLSPRIRLFFSEDRVFAVKYSKYSHAKSIIVNKLRESRIFSKPLEKDRIEMLMKREKQLKFQIKIQQKKIKEVDDQIINCKKDLEEAKERKRIIGVNLEKIKESEMRLSITKRQCESVKTTLSCPGQIEEEYRAECEALSKTFLNTLRELKKTNKKLKETIKLRHKYDITYIISKIISDKLSNARYCCEEKLKTKQMLLKDIRQKQTAAETRCLQLQETAKQLTENISSEDEDFKKFQELFSKLPITVHEIEAEIEETQVKADLLGNEDNELLREYEEREKKVAQMTAKFDDFKHELDLKKTDMSVKMDNWLISVENLVSKINREFAEFFTVIDGAGEVSLDRPADKNDVSGYGIKIWVKFKDSDPLQELGRKFQSGGERAVSTAIFVLALQKLITVPFRFIDEINQGMDPPNEKKILQLLINVTASKHATQYFFISPKLLPDIGYTGRMTVHCIHKGTKAIPSKQWNTKKSQEKRARSQKEDLDFSEKEKETKKRANMSELQLANIESHQQCFQFSRIDETQN